MCLFMLKNMVFNLNLKKNKTQVEGMYESTLLGEVNL